MELIKAIFQIRGIYWYDENVYRIAREFKLREPLIGLGSFQMEKNVMSLLSELTQR